MNHFFLLYLFINWRIIALQNFVVFYQTPIRLSHRHKWNIFRKRIQKDYNQILILRGWLSILKQGNSHFLCYENWPNINVRHKNIWSLGQYDVMGARPIWLKEYQSRRLKRWSFNPWVGKIPWSSKWQPTLVFLPGESHGAWRATVHGVAKSRTQLSSWACMHDPFCLFLCMFKWLDAWWCSSRLLSRFPAVLSENSCLPIHSPPRDKFSMALVWQKDDLF